MEPREGGHVRNERWCAVRKPKFDVAAFAADHPDDSAPDARTATSPASGPATVEGLVGGRRLAASREANKQAEAKGVSRETQGNKSVRLATSSSSRRWPRIRSGRRSSRLREKKGPKPPGHRPMRRPRWARGRSSEVRGCLRRKGLLENSSENDPPERTFTNGRSGRIGEPRSRPSSNLSGVPWVASPGPPTRRRARYGYYHGIRSQAYLHQQRPALRRNSPAMRPPTGRRWRPSWLTRNRQDGEMIKVTMGRLAVLSRKDLRTWRPR